MCEKNWYILVVGAITYVFLVKVWRIVLFSILLKDRLTIFNIIFHIEKGVLVEFINNLRLNCTKLFLTNMRPTFLSNLFL